MGAIAGGVIGGVAFIAILTFIIWRFCIRPRYSRYENEQEYSEDYTPYQEKSSSREDEDYTPTSQVRNSTHSVRSVASTVMTRASNVIQIAFIPGITDRQGHPISDVPPVPTIPNTEQENRWTGSAAVSPIDRNSHAATPDHFFTPADLTGPASRWSQFSNSTDDSEDIRSTRHQSLASSLARESVASTIIHDSHAAAIAQPMSASQVQAVRGKANVVSVKPSTGSTPASAGGYVPEVPAVDYFKYGDAKNKALASEERDKLRPLAQATTPAATSDTEKGGSSAGESEKSKKPSARLLAVQIEDATRRASRQPTHGGLGSVGSGAQGKSSQLAKPEGEMRNRDPSPFSDSNAVNTP